MRPVLRASPSDYNPPTNCDLNKEYMYFNIRQEKRNLIESCADINRVGGERQSWKEEERGGEGVRERERWSSGKGSEPGPWGAATDEVAE